MQLNLIVFIVIKGKMVITNVFRLPISRITKVRYAIVIFYSNIQTVFEEFVKE